MRRGIVANKVACDEWTGFGGLRSKIAHSRRMCDLVPWCGYPPPRKSAAPAKALTLVRGAGSDPRRPDRFPGPALGEREECHLVQRVKGSRERALSEHITRYCVPCLVQFGRIAHLVGMGAVWMDSYRNLNYVGLVS
jgi:hypothetical protein